MTSYCNVIIVVGCLRRVADRSRVTVPRRCYCTRESGPPPGGLQWRSSWESVPSTSWVPTVSARLHEGLGAPVRSLRPALTSATRMQDSSSQVNKCSRDRRGGDEEDVLIQRRSRAIILLLLSAWCRWHLILFWENVWRPWFLSLSLPFGSRWLFF